MGNKALCIRDSEFISGFDGLGGAAINSVPKFSGFGATQ